MQRRPWLSGPAGGSPRTLCYCPLMSHECAGTCAGHCVPMVSPQHVGEDLCPLHKAGSSALSGR